MTMQMPSTIRSGFAALLALLASASTSPARTENVFNELAGNWAGLGQIQLDGGKTERVGCRGYYNLKDAGAVLSLVIRCASSSYKIELRSLLKDEGGRVSGTWEERTFNATGDITGRATAGALTLVISGNINGSMSVTQNGGQHQVSIKTAGTSFTGVSINMSRG